METLWAAPLIMMVAGLVVIGLFLGGWFIGDMLKNLWRDE